jgi:imidazole glycerol-phosphate synthase subunit HisH
MIAVVDYGMGNLHSVRSALEAAGVNVTVTSRPEDLREAERIVLPGVGAFGECVSNLHASGLVGALTEEVLEKRKPLLGICVGLQVLATAGEENGLAPGLGWLPGVVRRLDVRDRNLKVPHTGWNDVVPVVDTPLLGGFRYPAFYFTHSYHFVPDDPSLVAATADHGGRVTAAVLARNIFATQFHPEKSQRNGLRLLENFLAWHP